MLPSMVCCAVICNVHSTVLNAPHQYTKPILSIFDHSPAVILLNNPGQSA